MTIEKTPRRNSRHSPWLALRVLAPIALGREPKIQGLFQNFIGGLLGQHGAQLVHGPGGQIVLGQEKHCILEKGEKQMGGLHKEGHSGIGVYAGVALWLRHGEALMVKHGLDGVGLEVLVLGKKVPCLFLKGGGALTPPRGQDGDTHQ